MKGGTGSLWRYLRIHPEIFMSEIKELDYFILERNYSKGIRWYESNFNGQAKEYGEASPNYTKHPVHAGVPERMHAVVPNAKLIYVVRDPIDRIISHYVHFYSNNKEDRTLSEALSDLDRSRYVTCSKYYMQLQQYLKYYPPESILIIASESLKNQRRTTLKTIFSFLNVDDSFDSPEYDKVFHKSSLKRRRNKLGQLVLKMRWREKLRPHLPAAVVQMSRNMTGRHVAKPELDKDLEKRLVDYLQEDVDSLRKYTGNDFKDWRL